MWPTPFQKNGGGSTGLRFGGTGMPLSLPPFLWPSRSQHGGRDPFGQAVNPPLHRVAYPIVTLGFIAAAAKSQL